MIDRPLAEAQASSSSALQMLGIDVFVAVASDTLVLPPLSRVLYRADPDEEINVAPLEVSPNRFMSCPTTGAMVAATLRASRVFYAALNAIYVRHVRLPDVTNTLGDYGERLLAVSTTGGLNVVLRGAAIAELASEESFRARFDVYAPVKAASQVLDFGASVLLDVEVQCPQR